MKPLVVLGAGGMLGRAVCAELQASARPLLALTRAQLDLTSADQVARQVRGSAGVLNCAAYTNVDGAESAEAEATAVNGEAVGALALACATAGVPLVHFSTDYVFSGDARAPYPVDAPRAPLNAYGRSKAHGEALLERAGGDHLLLRTSWVYAPWGQNFVLTMRRLLAEKPQLSVVDDQRGRPTSALWLARAALHLLDAGRRGTFHVTDEGECTWFELARFIAQELASPCEVLPCTSAEFPRPARRPAYSVLELDKTRAAFDAPLPSWQENVRAALGAAPAQRPPYP